MDKLSFSTRRLWVWLPPAFMFSLCAVCTAAGPGLGFKAFYGVLTAFNGYWLFRSWHVGVDVTDEAVVVRGQFRIRRFRWSQLRSAGSGPMRTRSPLYAVFPYVALTIELADGQTRQFEEVSASQSDRSRIDRIADAINAAESHHSPSDGE